MSVYIYNILFYIIFYFYIYKLYKIVEIYLLSLVRNI